MALLSNLPFPLRIPLHFHICGFYDVAIIDILNSSSNSNVVVHNHGSVTSSEYDDIVSICHIGLSLKLPGTLYATHTFPSKVHEYCNSSLLCISTDISDVKALYGSSLLYVDPNIAYSLPGILIDISNNLDLVGIYSQKSYSRVRHLFAPDILSHSFSTFIVNSFSS